MTTNTAVRKRLIRDVRLVLRSDKKALWKIGGTIGYLAVLNPEYLALLEKMTAYEKQLLIESAEQETM